MSNQPASDRRSMRQKQRAVPAPLPSLASPRAPPPSALPPRSPAHLQHVLVVAARHAQQALDPKQVGCIRCAVLPQQRVQPVPQAGQV